MPSVATTEGGGSGLLWGAAPLAAGGSTAIGTVGLNAYYGRPLAEKLLRNTVYSLGGAVATVGAWALLSGGMVTNAVLTAGNTVAGLCLRFSGACARLKPALQAFDTGEQMLLSGQLALQTARNDPRAAETALELQLEYMDGGVPGNTAIPRLSSDIVGVLSKRGDESVAFVGGFGDDAIELVGRHGEEAIDIFSRFGDEGVEVLERYGDDTLPMFRAVTEKSAESQARLISILVDGEPSIGQWSDVVEGPYVADVAAAFDGEPVAVTLGTDLHVHRYWSDPRAERGRWLTLDPNLSPDEARSILALPSENNASQLTEFVIPRDTTVIVGTVAEQTSASWAGSYALGGGLQVYVPDMSKLTAAPGS